MSEQKWYALMVIPKQEEAVAKAIKRTVKLSGMEQYVHQVAVPVTTTKKNGRLRRTKVASQFVLVRCNLTRDVQLWLLHVPGVIRIMGNGRTPSPVSDEEVKNMIDNL